MIPSNSTEQTRTIKRKIEVSAATAIGWDTKPPEGPPSMYASTELIGGAEEPAFECAVVKAGSCSEYWNQVTLENVPNSRTILVGTYAAPVNAITANLIGAQTMIPFGRRVTNRNTLLTWIGGSLKEDARLSYGDEKIIYLQDGTTLRETEDLIVTNGQCGTVVECTQLSGLKSFAADPFGFGGGVVLLLNADDTMQVRPASAFTEINPISSESAKQLEKRKKLKLAYQVAMAGLRSAEMARAQAVEREAKLGIDWNDWEDDHH